MHDPMTVAHEIKYPWWNHRPWPRRLRDKARRLGWDAKRAFSELSPEQQKHRSAMWSDGYRDTFITVWHVDPERNGTDDSCGFCVPHLPGKMKERLKVLAWNEARDPYFLRCNSKEWTGTRHEAECLYRGLILTVCRYAGIPITFDEAAAEAARVIHTPDCCDPAASYFCFLPGYHTNFKEDDREHRQEYFMGKVCGLARWLLKDRRAWYKHPRWHVWHWKVQCHPVQAFKRWAFSRCCKCNKGFSWGYSPCTNSWNSTGPRWFRSEPDTYHHNCSAPASANAAAQVAVEATP